MPQMVHWEGWKEGPLLSLPLKSPTHVVYLLEPQHHVMTPGLKILPNTQ